MRGNRVTRTQQHRRIAAAFHGKVPGERLWEGGADHRAPLPIFGQSRGGRPVDSAGKKQLGGWERRGPTGWVWPPTTGEGRFHAAENWCGHSGDLYRRKWRSKSSFNIWFLLNGTFFVRCNRGTSVVWIRVNWSIDQWPSIFYWCLSCWSLDRLVDWFIDRWIDWLIEWLIDWLYFKISSSGFAWLIDLVINRHFCLQVRDRINRILRMRGLKRESIVQSIKGEFSVTPSLYFSIVFTVTFSL